VTDLVSSLYVGKVTHKRLRPVEHRLDYQVFSVLIDLDELPALSRRSWLFSHNRWNALSLHDRDYADRSGAPIAPQIRALAAEAGVDLAGGMIRMLCYPRVFGYAFNPLTVYFCEDSAGQLACLVYEVSNTFGDRHSYVLPVEADAAETDSIFQRCDKAMFVSPFNTASGGYTFHVRPPGNRVAIGVMLRDEDGPKLKALFEGGRRPFTTSGLARVLFALPLMTLKVMTAIHVEALRLWLKRLPLLVKPATQRYAASSVSRTGQATALPTTKSTANSAPPATAMTTTNLDGRSVFGFPTVSPHPILDDNRLT
jgi:uncharacterized protein